MHIEYTKGRMDALQEVVVLLLSKGNHFHQKNMQILSNVVLHNINSSTAYYTLNENPTVWGTDNFLQYYCGSMALKKIIEELSKK